MCRSTRARRFHGIDPSRNKKDKKFRKVAEEQERKRRAMSEANAASSFSRMQAVQAATAAPYLVRGCHPLTPGGTILLLFIRQSFCTLMRGLVFWCGLPASWYCCEWVCKNRAFTCLCPFLYKAGQWPSWQFVATLLYLKAQV